MPICLSGYNCPMSRLTVIVGIVLLALGIGGYFGTHAVSVTALIPAAFGVLYIILGMIGQRNPAARMHVMHFAAMLSLAGVGGNISAIVNLLRMAGGAEVAHPTAVILRVIMAAICAFHLIAAIRSFVLARVRPVT